MLLGSIAVLITGQISPYDALKSINLDVMLFLFGIKELVTLAAGSTIAGNLLILGVASNVIIIQNSEKRKGETITFFDFAKIGIPLTILNLIIYWFFF